MSRIFCFVLTSWIFLSATVTRAELISGWDFSQYFGAGFLTTNGVDFVDTLSANYSELDPTFNAGAESGAFGTMFLNGQFGSTPTSGLGLGTEEFVPFTGSLVSNLMLPPTNPFDSFTVLESEGQAFTTLLSMNATDASRIVFSANLSSVLQLGSDWNLSFAGQSIMGSADVGVEFSRDGTNYELVEVVDLTDVDSLYRVSLDGDALEQVFVRLAFGAGGQSLIDNLGISANLSGPIGTPPPGMTPPPDVIPEPATASLLMLGLVGLMIRSRPGSS